MANKTSIEWADYNWNPLSGCSRKSKGCERCYAEKMTKRLAAMGQEKYQGLLNEQGRFNGVVKFSEKDLLAPLSWKKPRRVFVNSMSDLFHEKVTDEMDR
jgi:protein gp37